jgi:ABC-type multidrug transport system ATPase subunit
LGVTVRTTHDPLHRLGAASVDGSSRRAKTIEIRHLVRRFGSTIALSDVSLEVAAGEIHAVVGPNGAGKTTLIRTLAGLVAADDGEIRVLGDRLADLPDRIGRGLVGFVPSGDRSFYLRLSGLENLAFFARLHGLRRADALERARECLGMVGLADVGRARVHTYSHGMQKRLSVARALLREPPVLLVDEATHDLDPEGGRRVRDLVAERAARGSAVIWATQRIDEIRGFAHRVTLIDRGRVRFSGTIPQFLAVSVAQRHLLQIRSRHGDPSDLLLRAASVLGADAVIEPGGDPDGEHYALSLAESVTLGQVVVRLTSAGIDVLACREERSGIEEAFLALTRDGR